MLGGFPFNEGGEGRTHEDKRDFLILTILFGMIVLSLIAAVIQHNINL